MERAPVEHEVALILLQMASGLSSNEFEKFYELPVKVKKCELVKQMQEEKARKMAVGMTVKEKITKWNFELQHPKDDSVERHTMRMKWSKSASERQERECAALEKLRIFFMSRPASSYQSHFIKKFVPPVRMNASTECDEKHLV